MLVRTASLSRLLECEDMTSEDIMDRYWRKDGNIFSLLSRDCFIEVTWAELPGFPYAVLSYQWKQSWHSLVKFILLSHNRVHQPWMWIDIKCLDHMAKDKMTTVSRVDEIYFFAKEYHVMEIGSLVRGWVLYELSCVSESSLPPTFHLSTKDPALIMMVKEFFNTSGFDGSAFTTKSDVEFVRRKIIVRYGNVDNFNKKVIAILDQMFV